MSFRFDQPTTLDLSIIIVSFNTRDILINCIRSVYSFTKNIDFEIIVVDNHSIDGSPDRLAETFPALHLIRNSTNRGFSAANNQALSISRGRYAILLNSDTLLVENCFHKIIRFMDTHPEYSICTPQVVNPNHEVYPMRLWQDTPQDAIRRILGKYNLVWDQKKMKNWGTQDVETIGGSCFVVRRTLFEQIGLFDEHYFLYNEEDDFCRRCRNHGYKICYYSESSIIHLIGQSTHLPEFREKVIVETYKSNLNFYAKHYSPAWNFILRTLYRCTFLAGIIKSLFRWRREGGEFSVDDSITLKLKLFCMKVPKINQKK